MNFTIASQSVLMVNSLSKYNLSFSIDLTIASISQPILDHLLAVSGEFPEMYPANCSSVFGLNFDGFTRSVPPQPSALPSVQRISDDFISLR